MNVLLESLVGSTAYGLNTPSSDKDYLGLYLEERDSFLGLKLLTDKDLSVTSSNPDTTHHELGKFCRLALQCNPTVLELLWVPEELITVNSVAGMTLRKFRESFLSADRVRNSYLGYATSQLKRLQERGDFGSDLKKRTEKHARHLLRLLHQGLSLYCTGDIPIRLENPEVFFDFGRTVAQDPGEAIDVIRAYTERFNEYTSILPDEADRDKIEEIIQWIRKVY